MKNIVHLPQQDTSNNKGVDPYTHLDTHNPKDLFASAIYPYFNYYSKKIEMTTVDDDTLVRKSFAGVSMGKGEVCIVFAKNEIFAFLLNKLKNKNIFYINQDIATKDIERTWKILASGIDFKNIKKVYFLYPHFTKLVHAYRIKTIYGKEFEDITYQNK